MGDLIHKSKVVPFLGKNGVNPDWTQIKKSTTFTLALNPQTKTFDFISDEQPTEEIESYQPNLAQSLTMFKDEPDYEQIFEMVDELPTGEAAHRPVLVVFYKHTATYIDSGTEKTVYKAWKVDALVKLNQMDTVNENIDFDLGFNNRERGAVEIVNGKPSFIKGTINNGTFTPEE